MKRPKCYHVQLLPSGRWGVLREGAKRASATAETQEEAINRAQQLARIAGSDRMLIHEADGRVREIDVEHFDFSDPSRR